MTDKCKTCSKTLGKNEWYVHTCTPIEIVENKFMQSIVTPPDVKIKPVDFETEYLKRKATRTVKSGFIIEVDNIKQHKT